ncbi:hypothetical protein E2C01_062820 [Portunus trituberculatus]|uniref:Uncharacterized protein n=1 Tax=Portunus trituberculatus TaxID=210409 RepID=A0A5B7HIE7_PORTR|nr:hypothetical protein [Portunus trituberculatus]
MKRNTGQHRGKEGEKGRSELVKTRKQVMRDERGMPRGGHGKGGVETMIDSDQKVDRCVQVRVDARLLHRCDEKD